MATPVRPTPAELSVVSPPECGSAALLPPAAQISSGKQEPKYHNFSYQMWRVDFIFTSLPLAPAG